MIFVDDAALGSVALVSLYVASPACRQAPDKTFPNCERISHTALRVFKSTLNSFMLKGLYFLTQ